MSLDWDPEKICMLGKRRDSGTCLMVCSALIVSLYCEEEELTKGSERLRYLCAVCKCFTAEVTADQLEKSMYFVFCLPLLTSSGVLLYSINDCLPGAQRALQIASKLSSGIASELSRLLPCLKSLGFFHLLLTGVQIWPFN